MYPQPNIPPPPSTWAWDPFVQAQFRDAQPQYGSAYYTPQYGSAYYTPQYGSAYYTPQYGSAYYTPQYGAWDDDPWAAFGAIGGSLVRSEDQAVRAMADLFDRAANAGNTPDSARSMLRSKAQVYREASDAGAYDKTQTRVAIGEVAWASTAASDKRIYDKIVARWTRGAQQMTDYGVPRWAEVLDSEIDRVTGRVREVQSTTWEEAGRQTGSSFKKKTGLTLAVVLPILLVAGGIWAAVSLAPAFATLRMAYGKQS